MRLGCSHTKIPHRAWSGQVRSSGGNPIAQIAQLPVDVSWFGPVGVASGEVSEPGSSQKAGPLVAMFQVAVSMAMKWLENSREMTPASIPLHRWGHQPRRIGRALVSGRGLVGSRERPVASRNPIRSMVTVTRSRRPGRSCSAVT